MKKITFLLILTMTMSIGISQAQRSKRTSAYNYLRHGRLAKAKEAIDPCITHPKTMNAAKTWFYRGNIYLKIALSTDEKYKNLDPNALSVAYQAYKKALELDSKSEYKLDIFKNLGFISEQFYNKAVDKYNNKKYIESAEFFKKSVEVRQIFGTIDTLSIYNAAISYQLGNDYTNAEECFKTLLKYNYNSPQVYSSLSDIYINKKDTVASLDILKAGREKYPSNFNLIIKETNIYLSSGETEKALDNLNLAIKMDTTNPTIYFAVGANYDQILNDTSKSTSFRKEAAFKAESSYLKAIELDPDYFDANYNLGALYVNRAAKIIEEANKLPLGDPNYDKEKAKADELLIKSTPYLEKALEQKPDDINTLVSLKEIYTRTGKYDKLKEINAKIAELQ